MRFNQNQTTTIDLGGNALSTGGILASSLDNGSAIADGVLTGPVGGDVAVFQNSGNPFTISATIADNVGPSGTNTTALSKYGPGNLVLNGANTFSGVTNIAGGSITLTTSGFYNGSSGTATGLANSTLNYNGQGGTLVFDGGPNAGGIGAAPIGTVCLGGLSGSQALPLVGGGGQGVTLVVGYNNQNTTYGGVLSDNAPSARQPDQGRQRQPDADRQ